eukprot:TRINITY_DN3342_c0_g2_i1.p2 TRINITY_DN3342_c0_g2~~TRINITY_DN3342_c0_g2_i1.p2  ORF type:complete len:107 (-),score=19.33 TRINITY_DN3342_c0_g2_i1:791-1111(-)
MSNTFIFTVAVSLPELKEELEVLRDAVKKVEEGSNWKKTVTLVQLDSSKITESFTCAAFVVMFISKKFTILHGGPSYEYYKSLVLYSFLSKARHKVQWMQDEMVLL